MAYKWKEFTGETYEEWLDYHYKYSYHELVQVHINNPVIMEGMLFFKCHKDKE